MSTFDQALNHLRQGLPARRLSWSKGRYLMHRIGDRETILDICRAHQAKPMWVWNPSASDIVATDWVLIEDQERTYRLMVTG